MSLRRIWTLMRREMQATLRDPLTISTLISVPLLSLLLFGFILSTEIQNLRLGVIDGARSASSRRVLAELESQHHFVVVEMTTRANLDAALVSGEISVAVVIPPDFDRDLGEARGGRGPAEVQVLYDGGEVVVAGNAEGFLESLVTMTLPEITPNPMLADRQAGVEVASRALFNPRLDGKPFMVAGTYGWVLTFVAILITAVTIVSERLNGTFEQLQVTPATSVEILLGKMLPLGAIFTFDVALMALVAGLVMGVWPQGNFVLFIVVSAFYLLISLTFGLLISASSRSAAEAVQKCVISSFPLVMLSGFIYPIRSMPTVVGWISEIFPPTHYIRLSRAIYIRGAGLVDILPEVMTLLVIGTILVFAARRAIESRA